MLVGVISFILMVGAGFLGLRILGLGRGAAQLGLAPGVGVALLAVLATWALHSGLPEPVVGLLLLGLCLSGLALAVQDFMSRAGPGQPSDWPTVGMLVGAVLIPLAVLGPARFIQDGVPDYMHDGAHHAETIAALRQGLRLPGFEWYPTGFHAPAAALLALVPAVDSASGAVAWTIGLTMLAPLAIFGFSMSLWRNQRVAAAAALLLALTYQFPYEPHLYSVWPMAAGMLVMVALWTTALDYVARQGSRPAVLAGLLAAGLLLTHGTEIYTAAIGLTALAASRWKVLVSGRVAAHVSLALAVGLVLAAPYVPTVGGWAAGGGAVAVGEDAFQDRHGVPLNSPLVEVLFWASALSSGLLADLPVRLALVGCGMWVAFRQGTGRLVVLLSVVFAALVAMFRYIDARPVPQLYALTLPWGVDDRLLMTLPLLTAPLGGMGLVSLGAALACRSHAARASGRFSQAQWQRIARRALALALAGGLVTVVLVALKFSFQTERLVTYSADDAAAMAWLRQNARPGEVVMNDATADAGIWAPYKANVAIVLPRTRGVALDGPELLVRAHVGQLDTRADARDAACGLGISYVYRGASSSPADRRQFPDVEVLQASPALQELFSQGGAAIFRARLRCPP